MQLKQSDGRAFQPTLHVGFLKTCLNNIEQCLREWKIASNAHKNTELLLVKTAKSVPKPQWVQMFEDPV
jgi:hypothetical protein